jgi:hypothetical protein
VRGRVEKYQVQLDIQLGKQTENQQQLTSSEHSADLTLSTRLKAELEQQQPKIEQLQKKLNKASSDLKNKELQLAKDQRIVKATLKDVGNLLKQFPVGQGVRLIDHGSGNFVYGVVVGVNQSQKANNPAAPVNWKLNLLVVDGVRSLVIKLDNLVGGKKASQTLEPLETATSYKNSSQSTSIYELFDERQSEAKERRYLVSGQVLGSKLTGKFAQVTDNFGQVHPVYLLRRGFDPQKDLELKPVKIKTPSQLHEFLFEATQKQGKLQTADGNFTIIADLRPSNPGGIFLKTPLSTSLGGKYFRDQGLLAITGDFASKNESITLDGKIKSQSIMAVAVRAEKTNSVLSYISQKWEVGAATHKNAALNLLGETTGVWEPCDVITPVVELRAIAVPAANLLLASKTPLDLASIADTNHQEINSSIPYGLTNNSPEINSITPPAEIKAPLAQTSTDVFPVQQQPQLEKPPDLDLGRQGLVEPGRVADDSGQKSLPPGRVVESEQQESLSPDRVVGDSGQESLPPGRVVESKQQESLPPGRVVESKQQESLLPGRIVESKQQESLSHSRVVGDRRQESLSPRRVAESRGQESLSPDRVAGDRRQVEVEPGRVVEHFGQASVEPGRVARVNEARVPSDPARATEAELKPDSDSLKAQQSSELSNFFQGEMSLADALKLPPQPERPLLARAPTQHSHLNQTPTRLTPRRSKPAQSSDQQLSLFATTEYVNRPAKNTVNFKGTSSLTGSEASLPVEPKNEQLQSAQPYIASEQALPENNTPVKATTPISPPPVAVPVQPDAVQEVSSHPTVAMLNQLSDSDFFQTLRAVTQYFINQPPLPPSVTQQQTVQIRVQELRAQLAALWSQHATHTEEIRRIQKHPLRLWSHEYSSALKQLENTVQLISQALAQKDSSLAQLHEWKKQSDVRHTWENAATTTQMKELALTFKFPAMQERLNNVHQSQKAQVQDSRSNLNPGQQSQQSNQQPGRGRGR